MTVMEWLCFLCYLRYLKQKALVLVLCIYSIGIASSVRLKFGQSAAYTTSNAVRGLALKAGIEAAFKEANDNNHVNGIEFELVGLDDAYSASKALANAINFTTNPNIFGIVGFHATATAQAALPVINAANFPMVGTATGAKFLRVPFQRNIINYKAGYGDETALMVEYLINVKRLHRIAILMQNDSLGESGRDGVLLALKSNNLYLHSIGYYDRTSTNITLGLNTIRAVSSPPEAIIMVSTLVPTTNFMMAAKKIWPDIYYLCMSNMQPEELRNALLLQSSNDTTLLKNFIATQVVPLPTDTSIQVTAKFQAALRASDPTRTPDFNSFEGYMGARMVIMTISRMDIRNLTRANFIQTSYDTGMYNFDGLRCGPLIDADDPDHTPCNQCMKKVFFVTPNEQLNMVYLHEQPYRTFTTCGYQPYQWQFLRFGQTCDMTSVYSLCPDYVAGINAAIKEINDAGGIRGVKLAVVTLDDQGNSTKAKENIHSFASNPNVFGLIGLQDAEAITSTVLNLATVLPVFGTLSGTRMLRKPFQKSIINFRVSLDDEVGFLVTAVYQQHRITKFAMLYDDSASGKSGKEAVITGLSSKRLSIYAEAGYSVGREEVGVQNISNQSIDDTPEAILVFGTSSSVASVIAHANEKWPSCYFLVTSQTHQEQLVSILKNITFSNVYNRVILSQTVPLYTDRSFGMNDKFSAALTAFDPNAVATFTTLEGYLMNRFLIRTIGAQVDGNGDRQEFLDSIYQSGVTDISGLRCGPLELTLCNQALRNVWLHTLSINGTFIPLKTIVFETCGFVPDVNLDFQVMRFRFGFIAVAGVGILISMVLLLLLLFYRQMDWIKPNLFSLVLSTIGCILAYAFIFTLTPIPTPILCRSREWMLHLAFPMAFCPMFVKTWRVSRIFNSKSLRKIKITDKDMIKQFLLIMSLFMIGLLFVSIYDPQYVGEAWTKDKIRYERCDRSQPFIFYVMYVFHLIMLLWGSMLCYRVQGIDGRWAYLNESKWIAMCIYNTTFLEAIALVLNNALDQPNELYMINSSVVIICTSFVLGCTYFTPIRGMRGKLDSVDSRRSSVTDSIVTKKVSSFATERPHRKSSVVYASTNVPSELD